MNNTEALFTIIFCGVFGFGFFIMAITMTLDKKPIKKIPMPSPRLNNKSTKHS